MRGPAPGQRGEPRKEARQAHGSFHPAAYQRNHARVDLRPDRHRLHDGVRHHRHGELRARRRVHGVELRRADRAADPDNMARNRLRCAGAPDRPGRRNGLHLAGQLDDRARCLPAAARLVPPGAADLGDRHVDLPVELRAGDAGPAQQGDRAVAARRDRADPGRLRRHHFLPSAHHLGDHGHVAGRTSGIWSARPRSAARSAPASRTRRWRR